MGPVAMAGVIPRTVRRDLNHMPLCHSAINLVTGTSKDSSLGATSSFGKRDAKVPDHVGNGKYECHREWRHCEHRSTGPG